MIAKGRLLGSPYVNRKTPIDDNSNCQQRAITTNTIMSQYSCTEQLVISTSELLL